VRPSTRMLRAGCNSPCACTSRRRMLDSSAYCVINCGGGGGGGRGCSESSSQ
jgi:hypothetical protein